MKNKKMILSHPEVKEFIRKCENDKSMQRAFISFMKQSFQECSQISSEKMQQV